MQKIPYPTALAPQIEKAMSGLQMLTAALENVWHISRAAWNVDQNAGTIVFTLPNGIRGVAPVQVIGTYDTAEGAWLWAWDNPSIIPSLAAEASAVLAYGQTHGFDMLTTRKLECPEEQCWDLTALACMLGKSQGAYRGPIGAMRAFFTFGSLRFSKAP